MELGERIRELRKEREWSQQTLAVSSGLSMQTIVIIENLRNRNPSIDTIRKIAQTFDISVCDLIQ